SFSRDWSSDVCSSDLMRQRFHLVFKLGFAHSTIAWFRFIHQRFDLGEILLLGQFLFQMFFLTRLATALGTLTVILANGPFFLVQSGRASWMRRGVCGG